GHVLRILEALAAEDGNALLDEVEQLAERAPDFGAVLDELMTALQQLAVIQLVGDRLPDEELEELKPLAERISPEDVQLYFQIALQGRRDLPVGRDPRVALEMTLLRMLAFCPVAAADAGAPSAGPARPQARTASPAPSGSASSGSHDAPARRSGASAVKARLAEELAKGNGTKPRTEPRPAPERVTRQSAQPDRDEGPPAPPPEAYELPPPESYDDAPPPDLDHDRAAPIGADDAGAGSRRGWDGRWPTLIQAADVRGAARQLADHCELVKASERRLEVVLVPEKETLATQQVRSRLEAAISEYLGRPITLAITTGKPPRPTPAEVRLANENERMRRAREAMEQDPTVRAAQEAFGAVLEADTIQPRSSAD